MRSLLPLFTSLASLGSFPAMAQEPVDTRCEGTAQTRFTMNASDFQLAGYDSRRRILAVQCAPGFTLRGFRGPNRLRMPQDRVLIAMGPATVAAALDLQQSGELDLEVSLRSVPAQSGPERDCAEVEPDTVALRHRGGPVLGERDLHEPLQPPPVVQASVLVGRLTVEPADARVQIEALAVRARTLATACLERALEDHHSLNGAMTLELTSSAAGRPERPKVVVDGLVHAGLSACLVSAMHRDEALWTGVTPGARFYVPLYFRGSVVDPTPAQ